MVLSLHWFLDIDFLIRWVCKVLTFGELYFYNRSIQSILSIHLKWIHISIIQRTQKIMFFTFDKDSWINPYVLRDELLVIFSYDVIQCWTRKNPIRNVIDTFTCLTVQTMTQTFYFWCRPLKRFKNIERFYKWSSIQSRYKAVIFANTKKEKNVQVSTQHYVFTSPSWLWTTDT